MLATHRPDSITTDQLAPSLISDVTNISHSSNINNSISCSQKAESPDEAMFNDPDCVPIICDNKKHTIMFATDIASSSPTSPHCVSTTERASVWYSAKELTEIVQQATFALQIAHLSEMATNQNESFRGLEDTLSIVAGQESKARKMGAAQAVFHEQKRQRTTGVSDTSRMRMMSNKVSRKSKSLALERAEQDAKEVLEIEAPNVMPTGKGRCFKTICHRERTREPRA